MNKRGDGPRSLLRRLLKKADEKLSKAPGGESTTTESVSAEPEPTAPVSVSMPDSAGSLSGMVPENGPVRSPVSPVPRLTLEASPVRPLPPEDHFVAEPPPQLAPQLPGTQPLVIPKQITGIEERLQAEEALERLRQKTAQIAAEFSDGKLNRAQFTAMYAYYNERRVIIERLLARDPDTQAWQQVAKPGHTGFLRQHFEARVLAYSIYNLGSDDPESALTTQGTVAMPLATIKPMLTAIAVLYRTHNNSARILSPIRKQIENGRWITITPGRYTTSVALFSLEPSAQQFTLMQDLHRDFERANRVALARGIRVPDQLVFPHRALFEKPGTLPQGRE